MSFLCCTAASGRNRGVAMSAPAAIIYSVSSIKKAITSSLIYRTIQTYCVKCLDYGFYFSWLRHHICLLVLTVAAFFSILGLFRITDPYPLSGWFELRVTLKDLGYPGMLVFVLLVAVMPLVSPISILFITGSASYGPYLGGVLSYIGALLNAGLTFYLVRTLSIEEMWGKEEKTARIKAGIKRNGFRIVLLLQIMLVIPFVAINSAAAASGVHWKDFMKATFIGVLPSVILYSLIGEAVVSRFLPPEIYFAFIAVVLLIIIITALQKRDTRQGRKSTQ